MTEKNLSQVLRERMQTDNKRFWAGDNISEYIDEDIKEGLINEATDIFEQVLDVLLIDRENDPNSKGTAKRLAKMYFDEIMAGRYEASPNATAFPNDTDGAYEGMLVVRSELKSMCSHHHQPVSGVAHIWNHCWSRAHWSIQVHSYRAVVCPSRHSPRRAMYGYCSRN